MFVETNPVPIKFILKNKELIKTDNVRLPLVSISSQSNKDKIIQAFEKIF